MLVHDDVFLEGIALAVIIMFQSFLDLVTVVLYACWLKFLGILKVTLQDRVDLFAIKPVYQHTVL